MMKKIALSLVALAFMATTAFAASLTNKTYPTAQAAAKGGAAYAFSKAAGRGRYRTGSVKIVKTIDKTGPMQKYKVASKDGMRAKVMSVKKEAPRKFRAFVPNRYVYTPWTAYLVRR